MPSTSGEMHILCTTKRYDAVVWHANVFGGAGPEVMRMH
jgi:hypothetical protein